MNRKRTKTEVITICIGVWIVLLSIVGFVAKYLNGADISENYPWALFIIGCLVFATGFSEPYPTLITRIRGERSDFVVFFLIFVLAFVTSPIKELKVGIGFIFILTVVSSLLVCLALIILLHYLYQLVCAIERKGVERRSYWKVPIPGLGNPNNSKDD